MPSTQRSHTPSVQPPGESEQQQGDRMDIDTEPTTSSNTQSKPPTTTTTTEPRRSTRQTSKEPRAPPPPQQNEPQSQSQIQEENEHTPEQQEQQPSEEPEPEPEPEPQNQTPVTVTPGPRASRFQQVFAGSLKKTLDKINRQNFAACYPTVAQRAPGTLEFVQRQMVERLGQQCNKEFDSILQNRNVVAKLNELESLVSDASRRRTEAAGGGSDVNPPVPPHTLPAQTILQAHLHPHLTSTQSQLNAKLQTVQSHNAKLFEEIQAQRAEMERILAAVEEVLADVDGANGLLDEVVDDLAKETRAVESEMAGLSSTSNGNGNGNGMEIRAK